MGWLFMGFLYPIVSIEGMIGNETETYLVDYRSA